jgi:FkbM family methyltransferase
MRTQLVAALRRLGALPAVMPLTARVLCARAVRESLRFLLRELTRPRGVFLYHPRESGVAVVMRHTGVDAATLAEVFYHRYYEPPEQVSKMLGEPLQILDLGANIGMFGAFAATRWPQAQIVGYEPDPTNAELHERTIAANDLSGRWRLVRAAAGTHAAEVQFAAGLDVGSHLVEEASPRGASTITVAMEDVLAQVAAADLVKLDIEGGEWSILLDPRFAQEPPRALVLEYHPGSCPTPEPAVAVEQALAAAGLQTAAIWRAEDGHGMMWAWRV